MATETDDSRNAVFTIGWVTTSACLVLLRFFAIPLVDVDALWVWYPIVTVGFMVAGVVLLLWAIVRLALAHGRRTRAAVPVVACGLALALAYLAPLEELWVRANFLWYRGEREAIVHQVQSNDRPRVSRTRRRRIEATRCQQGTFVLFVFVEGVLGHRRGFLYRPNGCDLKHYFDRHPGDVEVLSQLDEHWYDVFHDD